MNTREKNLAKNTIILFIGTFFTKLITFLLLPLYTSVLTTTEYGIADLLNTLVCLFIPIVTFQVEQAVFRDLIESRSNLEEQKNIISSSLFSVIIQVMIATIIFLPISIFINNNYKFYLLLAIIINIFSSLFLQISRGLGETKKYSIASFLTAVFTIIFSFVFLIIIHLRVEGMILAMIIGQLACLSYIFVSLKLYKYISLKHYNKNIVFRLWKYSLPLVPNAISWWIFSSSDRLIVSLVLGFSMNGILSVASKFSSIYVTIYNIFDRSWIESVSLHINDKDISEYLNRMLSIILKLFTSLMHIMIVCIPFVFPIMIRKDYLYGYNFIPILLLGSFFTVCQGLIAVIYAAKKDTKSIAKTSALAALFNILIHLGLIQFIGLYAAVISTWAAYFIIFIYRLYDINKKYFPLRIQKRDVIFFIISTSMIFTLYYINNTILNILNLLIALVFAFALNENLLKNFKKNIKKLGGKNEK